MCNCCKSCKVPCITVTGPDVALGGSTTVITVPPFEGAIPPCGRVDLCLPPIFPYNNLNPVQINNGTVVYENITKCGNVLRTDQLSGHCCKFALPYLQQSHGSIVGISSVAGLHGLPGRTGYSASKYAMTGFLETLRIENL